MQITYPSHHRWLMDISSGLEASFKGRVGKKILSTLPHLTEANIHYHIEPLSEAFFTSFLPLYSSQIQTKQNALIHDIVEKTLHNDKNDFPYYCLSIYEGDLFIGGAIFSVRKDRVSYAYRSFIKEWQHAKLKAGPALVGEYAVAEFSCARGLHYISHGMDRNPYGLNANIGLATFKLSVGCYPSVSSVFETKTLKTSLLTEDCFILAMPEEGTKINKAYLVTRPGNEEDYLRATKYPDQLQVEVLYRTN
jgi:hypothetical protein